MSISAFSGDAAGDTTVLYQAKPREKVWAPDPISSAASALDGAKVGVDQALTGSADEDDPNFNTKVKEVIGKITIINDDDIKSYFLENTDTSGDSSKENWVALTSAKITNVNLVNDDVRKTLFEKIQGATKLSDNSGSAIDTDSGALVFRNKQLELENVQNTFEGGSVLADVYFAGDSDTNPGGSYVLTGEGSLYHKNVGNGRPLKFVSVEGKQLKVEKAGVVKAQYVGIGPGGSVSGYSVGDEQDASGTDNKTEREDYANLTGVLPDNPLIKNDQGEVVARQNRILTINSDAAQRLNASGYDEVSFSGKEWFSQNISAEEISFDKGEIVLEKSGTGGAGIEARTLYVGSDAIVRATKEGADVPVIIKGMDIELQKQVSNDSGVTWTVDGEVVLLERIHTINGKVMANIENIDKLMVSGTLITDGISGSQNEGIKAFSLGQGARVVKFSNSASPIVGSNEVEYVIENDQVLVIDVEGFRSFRLNGGVFEGNLTGSSTISPLSGDVSQNGFQGSDVYLTSGRYRGGIIESAKSIVVDGRVIFEPADTTLKAIDSNTGTQVNTPLKQVVLNNDVTFSATARPVIFKTYSVAYSDGNSSQESPVLMSQNASMAEGAELEVNLDLSESNESSAVPHMTVGKKLTVNNNVVNASIQDGNDYYTVRNFYEKTAQSKGKKFAIVSAGEIEGSFGEPISNSLLLKTSGVQIGSEDGSQIYSVNVSLNEDIAGDVRKEYSLSNNQAVAIDAMTMAAISASDKTVGQEIFGELQSAIASNSVKQLANESVHNEVINGGLAQSALTVHRKVNENISRRLDRSRTGVSSGDMFESQGFWGQYFYSDGSLDTKNDVLGFESKINGITIGVDADLNLDLTAGFAFSYAKSKLSTKSISGETKSDTYMGSVYAGWNNGPYFLDGMLSYAGSCSDIERAKYKADSVKGSMWGARAVGGYTHQIQQWALQPQVEFNYSNYKLDEFSESGGAGGQKVKINDYDVMELGAGLKVFGEFDAGRGTIKPEASLMAFHDFKDDKPAGSYLLMISPADSWIPLQGAKREQNRYALGLGGSYAMDNNLSFGLNYDYNWSGDFKAHGFMARISYEF